jgi:pyridoxal phosphate enzyme (YggS family)
MADFDTIKRKAEQLLRDMPEGVTLLAAAKSRSLDEVAAAFEGGIRIFGHNYVQEAAVMIPYSPSEASWHMIGHLQRNKARTAVQQFDMIETLDSIRLANTLEKYCAQEDKNLPVLLEINSGREENKSGLLLEQVDEMLDACSKWQHLQIVGLMTMGPMTGDPENARPYFSETRKLFEQLSKKTIPNLKMRTLSMGMSNSYRVAIEEGATQVRLGTALFGSR